MRFISKKTFQQRSFNISQNGIIDEIGINKDLIELLNNMNKRRS